MQRVYGICRYGLFIDINSGFDVGDVDADGVSIGIGDQGSLSTALRADVDAIPSQGGITFNACGEAYNITFNP